MTCFNEVATVRDSLSSLLGQLNNDYEVVVVDNFSTDGTYKVLREFEQSHKVKVIQRRSSRGIGRQVAFENASGEYILANLDLDDVFLPVLQEVVSLYHVKAEGKLLAIYNSSSKEEVLREVWLQNITIGPRGLIASLGGWRDLNLLEDWDIWSRADKAHEYCWTSLRFAENEPLHTEPKRAVTRLAQRYEKYRAWLQLGIFGSGSSARRLFSAGEEIGLSQRLAYISARLYILFHGVLVGQDPEFKSTDPRLYIDLATGERPSGNKVT